MTEDAFIYQFTLLYTPSAVGGSPIVRTQDVSISIECHYPRQAPPDGPFSLICSTTAMRTYTFWLVLQESRLV